MAAATEPARVPPSLEELVMQSRKRTVEMFIKNYEKRHEEPLPMERCARFARRPRRRPAEPARPPRSPPTSERLKIGAKVGAGYAAAEAVAKKRRGGEVTRSSLLDSSASAAASAGAGDAESEAAEPQLLITGPAAFPAAPGTRARRRRTPHALLSSLPRAAQACRSARALRPRRRRPPRWTRFCRRSSRPRRRPSARAAARARAVHGP